MNVLINGSQWHTTCGSVKDSIIISTNGNLLNEVYKTARLFPIADCFYCSFTIRWHNLLNSCGHTHTRQCLVQSRIGSVKVCEHTDPLSKKAGSCLVIHILTQRHLNLLLLVELTFHFLQSL